MFHLDASIHLQQYCFDLNICKIIYLSLLLIDKAIVFHWDVNIHRNQYYLQLNIKHIAYTSIFIEDWASVFYISANIHRYRYYSILYLLDHLPRRIVFKLGHCVFVRYEHPSAPIFLSSDIYSILYLGLLIWLPCWLSTLVLIFPSIGICPNLG